MAKFTIIAGLLLACPIMQADASRWAKDEKIEIRKAEAAGGDFVCWKRIDIRIDAGGTYATPFDPDEIAIDAVITDAGGKTLRVPAFFYQPFEWQRTAGRDERSEILKPGTPEWGVRFLPARPGRYTLLIEARDRSGTVRSAPLKLDVRAAVGHGYVRISRSYPRYFEFDDSTPYFAIGENLCWGAIADFERWIRDWRRMAATSHGCGWATGASISRATPGRANTVWTTPGTWTR
jgi:hypothetical protein